MDAEGEVSLGELYNKFDFETNVIIVKEIPGSVDKETLENFLEVITDNILAVIFPHHGPHTNIIAVFTEPITDKESVLSKSTRKKLGGCNVKVHFPSSSRAIVLYGFPPLPSQDHLELSCEKIFKHDCSGSQICDEKGIAVLHFPHMSKEDFSRVQNDKLRQLLQFDKMEPYLPEFHDDFIKTRKVQPSIKSNTTASSKVPFKQSEVLDYESLAQNSWSDQVKVCQMQVQQPVQQPVKATEILRGNADRNVLAESTILYEREERNGATAKPEVLYKREHTKPTPNLNLFDDDFDAKAELTTTCDVYTESNATNEIDDHSDSDESVVSQCSNPESGQRRSTRRRGCYRGREQFDPNDPTKVTETMPLTKGQIVMLKIGRVSQKAPECKFDLNASQEKVVIQGETYEKVTGAKIEIRQLLNNLKEHSVCEDQDIVKLFSSSRGSGFVRSTLKKNRTRAFVGFKVNSSEMFAYAYSMKEAKAAVTLIDSWIGRHECIVNENHSTYLSSPEWNAYMARSQKENLVSIRVNVNEKKIFITGVKAVVDATADEVNTKLSSVDRASDVGGRTVDISLNRPYRDTSSDHTETTTGGVNKVESSMGAHQHDRQSDGRKYTEKIKVEEGYARCLKKNRNLIYDQAKSKDWISDIDIQVKKKGQVTIEGTDQSSVWKAKQCIEEVLKNVWKGDLDLGRISKDDKDKAIMSHSLLSAKCGEFIKMFEQQYACGVIISPGHQRLTLPPSHSTPDLSHLNSSSPRPPHRSASTSALQSADHRSSHSDSPHRAPYVPHTPRLDRVESLPSHHIETAGSQPSGQNETVVIQKGNFKAVLKKGKIVEERAKILVNFFGVNGNHGVISESFKHAGGDAFNQGLTNITGESISPLSGGTLPCQYVLNIVLETYRNAQHLQMLQSRIEECFTWCGTLEATSIAFPAVGVGRLLRYPAEDVARIMKEEAERALDQSPRLQSLSFVIFDDETYGKFQRGMTNLHSRQTGLALSGPLVLPSRQGTEVQHHPEVRGHRHDYQGRRRTEDYGGLDRNEDRHHDVHRGHRYRNKDSDSNSKDRYNYHDSPRRHHGDDGYHRNKHHHDNNNKSDKPQGNENIPEAIVTLYCKDRNSGESCRKKLSKEIRDRFLSEEECDVPFGDKEGKRTVYKICNKHNVYVAEVEKDKKKTIPVLKGEKNAVDKATKEILRHFATGEGSKEVRRKRNNEHNRGTKQYWKFYADEPPTPKYWKHFKDGVGLFDAFRNLIGKARVERYDVDPKTFNAIKTLVEKTWVPKAGVGADAKNLNHSKLKVRKVERIENINLYKKYAEKRKELFAHLSTGGSVKKLEAIQPRGSAGNCKPILTANIDDRMNSDVFPEMNEYYLFHGTKSDLEDNIIHKGFDQRYCGDNAMFGRGVYVAESSTKADQYADDKDNRRKSNLHMFLVRVLLGEMYVSNVPKRFDLPPCRNCRSEKCADPKHHPYDSVVGDGKWLFREFVVYSQDQCYPEYVITYDRT